MIKNILFDLDGTLLPMNMEKFIQLYFRALSKRFCPVLECQPEQLIKSVWAGTNAMVKNDGTMPNKMRFWNAAATDFGHRLLDYVDDFNDFYDAEFALARAATTPSPIMYKAVRTLKDKGYNLVVATSPIFPKNAILNRLSWGGFKEEDFSYITTYENSTYGKPNTKYYQEICDKLSMENSQCLMVGNDVDEDMVTQHIGMETYLITDCLLNESKSDIEKYRKGTAQDFYEFVKTLPEVK